MSYVLSARSLKRLEGVHPDMVKLVKRAIEITGQDFVVQEGLRALATQKEYMKRGVTRTMASKHLKQSDGYGHAVDLVPIIKGQPRWEWPIIYPIAAAMRQASIELNIPIRWGGVWDRKIEELSENMKSEVEKYCVRHPGPDFLDGPHYELR